MPVPIQHDTVRFTGPQGTAIRVFPGHVLQVTSLEDDLTLIRTFSATFPVREPWRQVLRDLYPTGAEAQALRDELAGT